MWIKNGEYDYGGYISSSIDLWLYGGVTYRKLEALEDLKIYWFIKFLYLEI